MIGELDRKIAPQFKVMEKADLLETSTYQLDNGKTLYYINAGSQDVCRIELIFDAGSWHQQKPLVAAATAKLLAEGTSTHSAEELANKLDFYGAYLETKADRDFATVNLYSLNKHLEETLPVLKEILTDAVFPEKELKTFISRERQRQITNEKKVSYLASTNFVQLLFGNDHPYGYKVTVDDIEALDRDTILEFYKSHYQLSNCKIVLSGMIGEKQLQLVNEYFGKESVVDSNGKTDSYTVNSTNQREHLIPKDDAIQSAIKIGRPMFTKSHEDYHKVSVVNTILGGYFGSRLMNNIREDKGYTYGIGSGIASFLHEGYFLISTEVGAEVCAAAITEIYKEIELLQTELVGKEELDTVKSYMIGRFQNNTDGPFAWADAFVAINKHGLTYDYYRDFFQVVNEITPEEIRSIAQKYFQKEDLVELVVGKK